MSTLYATHGAAALKQIDTITVANTWATADTATMTINGKDLVVTIGADTSTTQVAQALRDAWNASSRLDSEGTTDATSNFGGQEFGEYAEAIASIDPDAPSVVIITATKAGVPFTLSVTETTAGSGTATEATAQAATGPWHWDNGDNWTGGAAPSSDDIVVLKDQSGPNVGFKYGLPNATLEVTIQHWMSYTGQIGLPPINTENGNKPYPEYRQRYVRLDDAGGSSDVQHRFGLGKDGTGSPLINLKHVTVKCSPIIYNTGTPQLSGIKALNICCTETSSTINIVNGSVDFSSQDSSTSGFATVKQTAGDSRGVTGVSAASNVTLNGGAMLIGGAVAIALVRANGGVLRLEGQTATITALYVMAGATVDYASTATITALTVFGGTFDSRNDSGAYTVTTTNLYPGSRFLDPYDRIVIGTAFYLTYDPSPDLQFGAQAINKLSITP